MDNIIIADMKSIKITTEEGDCPVESLPSELCIDIMKNVDLDTLSNLVIASKRYNNVFKDSSSLIFKHILKRDLGGKDTLRYAYVVATLEKNPALNMNNKSQLLEFLKTYCGITEEGFDENNITKMILTPMNVKTIRQNNKIVDSYADDFLNVVLGAPKPAEMIKDWLIRMKRDSDGGGPGPNEFKNLATDTERHKVVRGFYYVWYLSALFPISSAKDPKFNTRYLKCAFENNFDIPLVTPKPNDTDDFCFSNGIQEKGHSFTNDDKKFSPTKWFAHPNHLPVWQGKEMVSIYTYFVKKFDCISGENSAGNSGYSAEQMLKFTYGADFPTTISITVKYHYLITAGLKCLHPILITGRAGGKRQKLLSKAVQFVENGGYLTNDIHVGLYWRMHVEDDPTWKEKPTYIMVQYDKKEDMYRILEMKNVCMFDEWRLRDCWGLLEKDELLKKLAGDQGKKIQYTLTII